MKDLKINNNYSCAIEPSISTGKSEWWYLDGRLHRGGGKPAITTEYSKQYYHRGIRITEDIANAKLSPKEILGIKNMEQRQVAMEILGYEKFFSCSRELHRFTPEGYDWKFPVKTNPMYSLYRLETGVDEQNDPVNILMMVDPSKIPFIKYFIRVHPDETDCRLAVAHSYQFKTWEEYINDKVWV